MVENFWGEKEMRVGKYKFVLFKFIPYEYKSLEKYLEKMASKGWILKSMFGYFLRFIKDEPKNLKYTLDVLDKVSLYAIGDSDEMIEYREYCEAAGWNFVCARDKIQVFCKEDEVKLPIQTDEEEKFKTILKASFKYIMLDLSTVILILFSQYNITFRGYNAEFLADNTVLLLVLCISLWAVQDIIQFIHLSIWAVKGKSRLNDGEEVSYDFNIITNVKLFFNKMYLIICLLMILALLVTAGGLFTIVLLILSISVILVIYLRSFLSSSSYSSRKRKILFTAGLLAILIPNLIIMPRLMLTKVSNIDFTEIFYSKDYTLTLEDFNDVSNDTSNFSRKKKSLLEEAEVYMYDGKDTSISYELYKSKYKWIINYALNKEFDKFDSFGDKIIEIKSELPGNVKAYLVEGRNRFMIASDNTFITVYVESNTLSQNEILNIIYNKVFN